MNTFSPVKRYADKMVRRDDTPTLSRAFKKIGRNDVCPCGKRGLKYKQCCGKSA